MRIEENNFFYIIVKGKTANRGLKQDAQNKILDYFSGVLGIISYRAISGPCVRELSWLLPRLTESTAWNYVILVDEADDRTTLLNIEQYDLFVEELKNAESDQDTADIAKRVLEGAAGKTK